MKTIKIHLAFLLSKLLTPFNVKTLYLLLCLALSLALWQQVRHRNCLQAYQIFFRQRDSYPSPHIQKTTDLATLALSPLSFNEKQVIQLHQSLFPSFSFHSPLDEPFKEQLRESVLSSDVKRQFVELSLPPSFCLSATQLQELLPQISNSLLWKQQECSLSLLAVEKVASPHLENFYHFQIKLLNYQGFSHE